MTIRMKPAALASATGLLLLAACGGGELALTPGVHGDSASPLIHRVSLGDSNEAPYPAPMNLSIQGPDVIGLGFAWIEWTGPPWLSAFTYAYVYRNTVNDFATATFIGRSWMGSYFDYGAEPGTQYWYWVRYGDGTDFGPTASIGWPRQVPVDPRSPTTPAPADVQKVYEVAPASLQAGQAPVLLSENRVQVGAVRQPALDGLQEIVQHGDVILYAGDIQDGVTAATLENYLADDAKDSRKTVVMRFDEPPIVRIQKGATPTQIRETAHVVQLINYWLPPDWKLQLDLSPIEQEAGRADDGVIVVEFSDRDTWDRSVSERTLGYSIKSVIGARVYSARVWIDPNEPESGKRLDIVMHELLHALGRGHVNKAAYPDTVMTPTQNAVNGYVLHPLDQDALTAVYGVLGQRAYTRNLATNLGAWADVSSHLVASLPDEDVQFGVAERNGFALAWAEGPRPLYPLADNPALEGSASWGGRLVGYTPATESVAGNMNMAVDLATLIGDLDFTEMEKWAVGENVGEVGTGSVWNVGALNYAVRVSGNHFLRIGGDEGELAGAFFGNEHDAAGGTLYRDDLTAGFGGTLQ